MDPRDRKLADQLHSLDSTSSAQLVQSCVIILDALAQFNDLLGLGAMNHHQYLSPCLYAMLYGGLFFNAEATAHLYSRELLERQSS